MSSTRLAERPPRGLTISEAELHRIYSDFNERHSTDEHCTEVIVKEGFKDYCCERCKCPDVHRNWGESTLRCTRCASITHLFADTFFERVELTKAYLFAIRLKERGIGISKNRFSKLLRISGSASWELWTKLDLLIARNMPKSSELVCTGAFDAVLTKRSSETEARKHPLSEQEVLDKKMRQKEGEASKSETASEVDAEPADEWDEAKRRVFESLSDEPTDIDWLCDRIDLPINHVLAAIAMLEIEQIVTVNSGWVVRSTQSIKGATAPAGFECTLEFLQHVHHGISRKQVQPYAAAFWCYKNGPSWSGGSLLELCAKSPPISRFELRSYVSPPHVKVQQSKELK